MEVLVTLTLFLIVLAIFASLGREYSRVTHFSSAKTQSMQAANVGLEGAARELRGAVAIHQPPSPGANTTILSFDIVNPSAADRLFPASAPPKTPVLNLNISANLLTIEYTCTTSGLQRRALTSGGTVLTSQIVADGVTGFSAQVSSDKQTALLAATVQEEHMLRVLTQPALLLEGI
jgi:hypothetical protein